MSVRKNLRISEKEDFLLKIYSQQEECSETETVRLLLRTLEDKLSPQLKKMFDERNKTVIGNYVTPHGL